MAIPTKLEIFDPETLKLNLNLLKFKNLPTLIQTQF